MMPAAGFCVIDVSTGHLLVCHRSCRIDRVSSRCVHFAGSADPFIVGLMVGCMEQEYLCTGLFLVMTYVIFHMSLYSMSSKILIPSIYNLSSYVLRFK